MPSSSSLLEPRIGRTSPDGTELYTVAGSDQGSTLATARTISDRGVLARLAWAVDATVSNSVEVKQNGPLGA